MPLGSEEPGDSAGTNPDDGLPCAAGPRGARWRTVTEVSVRVSLDTAEFRRTRWDLLPRASLGLSSRLRPRHRRLSGRCSGRVLAGRRGRTPRSRRSTGHRFLHVIRPIEEFVGTSLGHLRRISSGNQSQSSGLANHRLARRPSGGHREGSARSRATLRSRSLLSFHCLPGSGSSEIGRAHV